MVHAISAGRDCAPTDGLLPGRDNGRWWRDALTAVGGLEALKSYLADDFMLGCLLVGKWLRNSASDYIVEHVVQESDLATTFQRELWGAQHSYAATTGIRFLVHDLHADRVRNRRIAS